MMNCVQDSGNKFQQKINGEFFTNKKVIIGEKYSFRTVYMGIFHLVHNLVNGLTPILSSHNPHNIAEVAVVGAAAARLHRKGIVVFCRYYLGN
jgi:hypothetical protein